jgi:hypothetical protein
MTNEATPITYSKNFLEQYAAAKEAGGQTLLPATPEQGTMTSRLAASLTKDALEKLQARGAVSDTIECSREALEKALDSVIIQRVKAYVAQTNEDNIGVGWAELVLDDITRNIASTSEGVKTELVNAGVLGDDNEDSFTEEETNPGL